MGRIMNRGAYILFHYDQSGKKGEETMKKKNHINIALYSNARNNGSRMRS